MSDIILLLEEVREKLIAMTDKVKFLIQENKERGLPVIPELEHILILGKKAVDQKSDQIQAEAKKKEESDKKKELADKKELLLQLLEDGVPELEQMLNKLMKRKSAAAAADPPVSSTAASGDAPTAGPSVGRFFKKQVVSEVHDIRHMAEKKRKVEKTENKDPNAGKVAKRGRQVKQVTVPAQKKKKPDSGSETETEEADARLEKGLIRPQTPGRKGDEEDSDGLEWF